MTSELRPAAWMYRRMTTAEGDRVEFTRTPWAYVLTGYTETPLYTREAVRAEQARAVEVELAMCAIANSEASSEWIDGFEFAWKRARQALGASHDQ